MSSIPYEMPAEVYHDATWFIARDYGYTFNITRAYIGDDVVMNEWNKLSLSIIILTSIF